MGCAPSSENSKENPPTTHFEIKLPANPVVLPDGFSQYDKNADGTYRLKPAKKPRSVPRLTKIDESQIIKRRQTMKKVVSSPDISDGKRSMTMDNSNGRLNSFVN